MEHYEKLIYQFIGAVLFCLGVATSFIGFHRLEYSHKLLKTNYYNTPILYVKKEQMTVSSERTVRNAKYLDDTAIGIGKCCEYEGYVGSIDAP